MRRILFGGFALLMVAVISFGIFRGGWTGSGPLTATQNVVIAQGASLSSAAHMLEETGAIISADAFLARARAFGGSAPIKAGEYELPAAASASEILTILQQGRTVVTLLTIPEGMPSILVKERLEANQELTGDVPLPPEGSILPDSYAYEKGESRAAVLARMQDAMTQFLAEQWTKRADSTPVETPKQAIILASIVEKETAVAKERATVAGVYSNRLRQGMMLQADPTIIYPITQGKSLGRRIRLSEIQAVNDYNTYAMTGLPKGPIANPGRAAIEAVLNPAETDALYFVADGEGGHIFANTLAEHEENVRKWYEIRRQRGEM